MQSMLSKNDMSGIINHRTLAVNGIQMHIAEQGEGPLVLLCHGWPELWYSWRHQLKALANAGFRAAAPDMRGFGRTSSPDDVGAYTIFHTVGDVVALVAALGEKRALIIGHDSGAPREVPLPAWLGEADIGVFAAEYQRTGFRGGLNWYRNIDRNWELTAPWHHAKIAQPALFIAGSNDAVITGSMGQRALDELESVVPNLQRKIL